MKNYVATALINNYGFISERGLLWTGRGSWFSGGSIVEITFHGETATVSNRKWLYNQYGDCVYDRTEEVSCHLSQVWGFIPEWVLSKR